MEELERYERGIVRLKSVVENNAVPLTDDGSPIAPMNYVEFLEKVQLLRRNVSLQIMEAKSALSTAKTVRNRLRTEIPDALAFAAPHRLSEFRALTDSSTASSKTPVKTPLSNRKRLNADGVALARKLLDRDAANSAKKTPKSPKSRTPVSMAKSLFANRSIFKCTPVSARKTIHSPMVIYQKFGASLGPTPQKPIFSKRNRRTSCSRSITRTLTAPFIAEKVTCINPDETRNEENADNSTPIEDHINITSAALTYKFNATVTTYTTEPNGEGGSTRDFAIPQSNYGISNNDEMTPEMKERIRFFNNPNIENIHQRYVAIQDAEDSTCLLSSRPSIIRSITPERPLMSARKTCLVSTDPKPAARQTPEKPRVTPSATSAKKRLSRTPSPPHCLLRRNKPAMARKCLASQLINLTSGQEGHSMQTNLQNTATQANDIEKSTINLKLEKSQRGNPSLGRRSLSCSNITVTSETTSAVTEGHLVQNNLTKPINRLADKTPDLKEFTKRFRIAVKQPLKDVTARMNYDVTINRLTDEVDTSKSSGRSAQNQAKGGEKSLCQGKIPSKVTSATSVAVNEVTSTLKSAMKTPSRQTMSVNFRTDEKMKIMRPSKMNRQSEKK